MCCGLIFCLSFLALAAKLGIGCAGAASVPATQLPAPAVPIAVTEEIMQQTMVLQMQLKSIGDRLTTVSGLLRGLFFFLCTPFSLHGTALSVCAGGC